MTQHSSFLQAGDRYDGSGELHVSVETIFGQIEIYETDERFHVVVDNIVRHPDCSYQDVLRAMANYLQGISYQAQKLGARADRLNIA